MNSFIKSSSTPVLKLIVFSAAVLVLPHVHAAKLLLDFGPTTVTGTDTTLSMGHFSGAVQSSETTWNHIVNTDIASGLLYADGSAATGVSITVGRSDLGASNTVDFANKNITSSALGGSINLGIYANTSPIKDGIFATGTATVNTNAVGIRINGLDAGTYTIYLSGRNTSTGITAAQRFFATNGSSSASFSFATNTTPWADELNSASAPGSAPNQANAITGTFAYGDNCIPLVVTLGAGDSLFLAASGAATNEFRGFLNSVEVVAGLPVLTNFPPTVGVQPVGTSVYAGATVTIGNVKYGGLTPLFYQWLFNGTPINGATNPVLTLSNVTAAMGGNYRVSVSNSIATTISSNANVNVVPLFNTGQMTNIWNLLPGDRFYVTVTNNTSGERGLAYDPVTADLLLVSQLPTNNIVVLNATNGAEKYFMSLSGVPGTGGSGVNMIGVADDGVVYVGNATANAGSASTPYNLWQWADDGQNTVPVELLSGDPGYGTAATGLRWGDNLAVRGAGATTQILIAPSSGTNVCFFTTGDGFSFQPTIVTVTGVPSGFAQFGVAFGPLPNTFWAKTLNQQLYLIQYDLGAATGAVLQTYSATNMPNSFRFVSVNGSQKWMAGVMSVASGLPDNVRLYDVSDLTNGPALADQELYSTANANNFLNGAGTGSTAFGGNYLFALDSNNGIKAFLINTNFTPSLDAFNLTGIIPAGPDMVLTWQSVTGHTYQVQAKTSLSDSSWANVGAPITASSNTTSATNSVSGDTQFYRVQGQ